MQIGGHTDGSEDTGNTDSDADWDPTIRINFTWIQNGNEVVLNMAGQQMRGTILQISETKLKFSYPINTIPEKRAVRIGHYTRINQ